MSEQLIIRGLEPTPYEELATSDIELTQASEQVQEANIRYNAAIIGRIVMRNKTVLL